MNLSLPPGVDVRGGHGVDGRVEILGLEVPDDESVVRDEQRVVPPARFAERGEHLRPDVLVAGHVLVAKLGLDPQQEADAVHSVVGTLPCHAVVGRESRRT